MGTEKQAKTPLETLKGIVKNAAILEVSPSLDGISEQFNQIASKHDDLSIYYGTGICTPQELSVALPFDVLGMMLFAEKLRRSLGFSKVIHHIADTHAKTNLHLDAAEADKIADKTLETIERIVGNLSLSIQPVLSSSFDSSSEYRELLHTIPKQQHDYIWREVADMEWYRRKDNMYLKLGWIIQSARTSLGSDERVFDSAYRAAISQPLSFLYLKAGRTLDLNRPKASPYISIPGEQRIILDPQENVRAKLQQAEQTSGKHGKAHMRGIKKHLLAIVRLYQEVVSPLDRNLSLEEKVQIIIDRSLQ